MHSQKNAILHLALLHSQHCGYGSCAAKFSGLLRELLHIVTQLAFQVVHTSEGLGLQLLQCAHVYSVDGLTDDDKKDELESVVRKLGRSTRSSCLGLSGLWMRRL